MPMDIRPVIIQIIVWFNGRELSHWEMSGIILMTSQNSCDVFVNPGALPKGCIGIGWRDYVKGELCPSSYHERKQVSLSVQDQGAASHVI